MSDLPPPPHIAPEPPPAAKAKGSKTWLWVTLAGLVGLLIGVGIGAGANSSDDDTAAVETASADASTTTTTTTNRPTTTTTTVARTPEPTDFTMGVIETSRSCFGSAGCNIEYRIDVTYTGPELSDDYTVVYDLLGGETTKTDNFTVSEDGQYRQTPGFISTPPNPTLTATATRVLPN